MVIDRSRAALPRADYDRLAPHLEPVELAHGQAIYHTDAPIEHVHFPINSTVSLVSQMAGGASVEVGVTGFEGVVGLPVLCDTRSGGL